jgi:hypothetical protein
MTAPLACPFLLLLDGMFASAPPPHPLRAVGTIRLSFSPASLRPLPQPQATTTPCPPPPPGGGGGADNLSGLR